MSCSIVTAARGGIWVKGHEGKGMKREVSASKLRANGCAQLDVGCPRSLLGSSIACPAPSNRVQKRRRGTTRQ
jgi:hypothetical protein